MPKREEIIARVESNSPKESTEKSSGKSKYSTIVDLEFLPESYIKRIDEIFDSYFRLGMKVSKNIIESDSSPKFPQGVSSLSSPELGNKLSEYTAWFSYASDKFKYILVACTYIESEMGKVMDRVVGGMMEGKGNIDAKKAKARSSDEYIMLISYHQKIEGLKILLDNELKNYDKCIQSLSREVSRRENNGGY